MDDSPDEIGLLFNGHYAEPAVLVPVPTTGESLYTITYDPTNQAAGWTVAAPPPKPNSGGNTDEKTNDAPTASPQPESWTCGKCSYQNKDPDGNFCTKCGARRVREEQKEEDELVDSEKLRADWEGPNVQDKQQAHCEVN